MAKWKVKLWNGLTSLRRAKCKPHELLLVIPSCLQWSGCRQLVKFDLANCKRCGRCQVKDMIELSEEYHTQCSIATGGRLALLRVKEGRVKAVVAVACEKELEEGMRGAFPKPVMGVINLRPNGPCKDTAVNVDEVRNAIEFFLRDDEKSHDKETEESEKALKR